MGILVYVLKRIRARRRKSKRSIKRGRIKRRRIWPKWWRMTFKDLTHANEIMLVWEYCDDLNNNSEKVTVQVFVAESWNCLLLEWTAEARFHGKEGLKMTIRFWSRWGWPWIPCSTASNDQTYLSRMISFFWSGLSICFLLRYSGSWINHYPILYMIMITSEDLNASLKLIAILGRCRLKAWIYDIWLKHVFNLLSR